MRSKKGNDWITWFHSKKFSKLLQPVHVTTVTLVARCYTPARGEPDCNLLLSYYSGSLITILGGPGGDIEDEGKVETGGKIFRRRKVGRKSKSLPIGQKSAKGFSAKSGDSICSAVWIWSAKGLSPRSISYFFSPVSTISSSRGWFITLQHSKLMQEASIWMVTLENLSTTDWGYNPFVQHNNHQQKSAAQ